MTKRRLFGISLAAASILLVFFILTDLSSFLRGPAPDTPVWYWPYRWRGVGRAWLLGLTVLGYLLLSFWWLRLKTDSKWIVAGALSGLVALAVVFQVSVVHIDRGDASAELIDRALANNSSGYFSTALSIGDMGAALRDYPALMARFESDHARTHPPGLIVLNWLTLRGFERSDTISGWLADWIRPNRCADYWLYDQPDAVPAALGVWTWLPVLAAALCVVPAYLLAQRLTVGTAKLATVFVAAIPALLIFAPAPDQLFALLVLLSVLLLHEGLRRKSVWGFFLSGLLLSLNTFLSIGNAILIVPALLYALLEWHSSGQRWARHQTGWAVAFASGAAAVWLVYWVGYGVAPWAIVQSGMAQHVVLVNQFRSYTTWLGYNWIDLLVFAGLPVIVGFLIAAVHAVSRRRGRTMTANGRLALALLIFLVILSLSGTTRGETGRLWLFFMPLLAITAGNWFETLWRQPRPQLGLIALQLAFAVAIGLAWRPMVAQIVEAQAPVITAAATPQTSLGTTFDEQITLLGFDLPTSADPDSPLPVTLYWSAETQVDRPYTIFVHLADADTVGPPIAQDDGIAVNGTWPPTCWQDDAIVIDEHVIDVPPSITDGEYAIRVGLYDARDNTRLLLADGSDFVELGMVTIGR
ncbi:MAG: hypothetical protein M9928_06225 [Anaerolineae bacterium]|nr:hypothetical protein [Anaerolineae bacterium]